MEMAITRVLGTFGIQVSAMGLRYWAIGGPLHVHELQIEQTNDMLDTLEQLRTEGLIRTYGWSTDSVTMAEVWIGQPGYSTVENPLPGRPTCLSPYLFASGVPWV